MAGRAEQESFAAPESQPENGQGNGSQAGHYWQPQGQFTQTQQLEEQEPQEPEFNRSAGSGGYQPPESVRAGGGLAQTRETASQLRNGARGVVAEQVDTRTAQIGNQVFSIASDLRRAAENLRSQGSSTLVANIADQAGGKIEQLAAYVQNADLDQLTDDLKRAAKQQPWAVAAGLFALGFGASRLIKASANESGGR